MKRFMAFVLAWIAVLGLAACDHKSGKDFDPAETFSFHAAVLEVHDSYLLVEPSADSNESKSADKIQVSLKDKTSSWPMPAVGDFVNIVYDGNLMETYPAQLGNVYRIEILETKPQTDSTN